MARSATRRAAPKPPPDPAKLRRETAGRYVSGDERFTVDLGSSGWLVSDASQANELGLPLVRGPFATLDEARAAMRAAREGPAPISDLADRLAARPKRPTRARPGAGRAATASVDVPTLPEPPPLVVREYRSGDAARLRALWATVGFNAIGDDDAGLRAFAQRNPGTFLVALRGAAAVGSAMGGWDGRRGWIYHVATAEGERRTGLATRLVRQIEQQLAARGARKVNVVVQDGNEDGVAFWESLGYDMAPVRQYGRELRD